ncbi:MAG: NfeD family protein [Clostridia bacterium]|nr:NfeD family protein [Clostridia bacterium]
MLDHMLFIWCIFFVLCIVTEAATMSLVAVWFMPGALIAMVLSLLSAPVWLQVLVFLVLSALLLLFTRRLSARLLGHKTAATNADRVIGKEGIVTETINDIEAAGQVKVLGQIWSARCDDPLVTVPVGTALFIKRTEGVRLIVSPVPSSLQQNNNSDK